MAEGGYLIDGYQEKALPEILERAQWAADAHDHYELTRTPLLSMVRAHLTRQDILSPIAGLIG